MTLSNIRTRIESAAKGFDHLSGPQQELLDAILAQFDTTTSSKTMVDNDGNLLVWCNYHNQYEPAELFDTKTTKTGREAYKASCREGEKERRHLRSKKRKAEHLVTQALVKGLIDADEATELLRSVEAGNYDDVIGHITAIKEA